MKQHITEDQLNKLSAKSRNKFNKKLRSNGQIINLLNHRDVNIGNMIEFLDNNVPELEIRGGIMTKSFLRNIPDNTIIWHIYGGEWSEIEDEPVLCDALWEAVIAVLEK